MTPLLDLMLEKIPAPTYDEAAPLQAHVTNLDASPYVGRLAICRVRQGTIRSGQQLAWCRADGSVQRAAVSELYVTQGLERVAAEEAGPGEIIAVAGIEAVTIGETLADPEDPRPLPVITVDEPSLSVVVGVNNSPLAGTQGGDKLTARQIRSRLDAELVGNVSLAVLSVSTLKKNPNLGDLAIPRPLLTLPTNMGIRAESDRRYKDFLSAWADYNRAMGQTREWMLKGFEAVGLTADDLPPEVQF